MDKQRLKTGYAKVQEHLHVFRGAESEMDRTSALAEAIETLLEMLGVLGNAIPESVGIDVPMSDRYPEGLPIPHNF